MRVPCEVQILVLASFTVQANCLGLKFSFGQLFAALKSQTGESAGTLALIGSSRDFVFHLTNMLAGFTVRKLGYVRMMSAGLLALVASLLLDSRAAALKRSPASLYLHHHPSCPRAKASPLGHGGSSSPTASFRAFPWPCSSPRRLGPWFREV